MNVLIWNEFRHEQQDEEVAKIYPNGIHEAIKAFLETDDIHVETATLDEPNHGITDERLSETDVMLWWGHLAHHEVADEIVDKVHKRVLEGMGLIVLHSGHFSKIFQKLMGTGCDLKWREADEKERMWVVNPSHPIVEGIGEYIEIEKEEMYGEHFDIPAPDELVLVSWFEGGEVFRSGCTYRRGHGKVFYFRPGHEGYPTYYHQDIQKVIQNAVRWAKPTTREFSSYGNAQPLEEIKPKS
ncbi:ThuA domain-containing protein [Gracilibacillus thailandensis]|uniref:Trehalose utilization protein ThuA n=1 Tax=Gracilibacillus thailandensis TaxID=563735 RepID=A0A6N7QY22_9BACI|nr:ThuA domain-containing protein [Gracilibacillus thailandensis]MRI65781.1 trehalose utilization protein ThuA [Gracilibacillus thailandensis]